MNSNLEGERTGRKVSRQRSRKVSRFYEENQIRPDARERLGLNLNFRGQSQPLSLFKNVIYFYWKIDLAYRGVTERSSIHWFPPPMAVMARAELGQPWQPGACLMLVQHPEDLCHSLLLSQTIGRELNWKWSSWDTSWCRYGMLGLRMED